MQRVMAVVIRGNNHGKKVVLHQWCNDWFTDKDANVYKPSNLKFTDAEVKKIKASDSGIMFTLFEWKGNRLFPLMSNKKLSIREVRFVEEMTSPDVKSGTQAAKDAGYSPDSAHAIANENLKKPYIIEAIENRKAEAALFSNITPEQVIGATAQRAFATLDDAFDEHGYFDMDKARETGAVHLIKKISRNPTKYGENVSVEFYPKDSAQDKLGTYLGLEQKPRENESDDTLIRSILAGIPIFEHAHGRKITVEDCQEIVKMVKESDSKVDEGRLLKGLTERLGDLGTIG